ncbi:Family T1, proteasome alpha subunit, threonine peptidase [Trichomonas vaginalis G3]|uniref:Family T1, proteasome alpha subunit, threonine peptidase n=1 Tax=Trichomonas vaginalis (strain ATCC PRA-98 / G3) TaxID=412133 RepID=A2F568_TRIV3|nr:threonine-type endopeptidase protein [Trichomonas vaginalis G3]EAX99961.1 Family T1, proteasome alpha subunit, threonine peptidase [Trichomonas vaginalis G3]KAI5516726.1 threonine-type endopeptidase protein [Trichomonas vaginalis G3]|eukprot:XP_001312891.1 Family T1, proteasome alpha subunit, threonine peptidase [Trichomonas vaginalis G3]
MSSGADRYLTVFSAEGRLWQVEYSFKAVKQAEVTAVAVKSKNAVCVAVQKKVSDKLIDPSTVTHMYRITDNVGACLVGLPSDVNFIVMLLRSFANNFEYKQGFSIPVSILAQMLSERHQLESQLVYVRPSAVSAILFGLDGPSDSFALYKIEPSGYSNGFRAVACGVKEIEAMSALEKKMEDFETPEATAEFTLSTLQTVCGVDFEAQDVEVSLLTRDNSKFSKLPNDKVNEILHAVAEKD